MAELSNPLAIFLAGKCAENPNGHAVTISWEAAHQIIAELDRQDWLVERLATGAGAVIERERKPKCGICDDTGSMSDGTACVHLTEHPRAGG